MKEYKQELIQKLLEKNPLLTFEQAQTWIELLWDDFETTHAKAGREYQGSEMALKIVSQWVELYGSRLHEFVAANPKYRHLLEH